MTGAETDDGDRLLIRRLRLASWAEATTLVLLLLVAVPLKHAFGFTVATRIAGPVHGAAFVAYGWCLALTLSSGCVWTRGELARLVIGAFLPFGGFLNGGILRRKEAALTVQEGKE